MKISNDQNRIELDDGTVLVASGVAGFLDDDTPKCDGCYARDSRPDVCLKMPCCDNERVDGVNKIFIKEQPNA
ncbi:MAG: hypothetical protein ACRDC6_19960 [Shewanella sp.]